MTVRSRTVAVTGATGFLGSHIAQTLLDEGAHVRGVVRSPARGAWLADQGVDLRRATLADAAALREAFVGADVVVANAAMGSFQGTLSEMAQVNEEGLVNSLEAAAQAGVSRLILISSVAVYRTRLWRKMSEEHPKLSSKPLWNWTQFTTDWRYALTKARGEQRAWDRARSLGLKLTVVRPGPVYGPRDRKVILRLIRVLDQSVAWVPTVGMPLVHVGDVSAAVVVASGRGCAVDRAYNLCGPSVSLHRLISLLKQHLQRETVLIPVPIPAWVEFDCSAAERDLGFESRSVEEGLRETIQAFLGEA